MRKNRVASLVVGAVLAATSVAVVVSLLGPAAAQPSGGIDPSDFTSPVPNPYFPLTAGLVLHYRGTEDGQRFREVLKVTHHTKTILGVKTTVIRDILRRADGSLAEKTHDWYANDNTGNVWYFGEQTATYGPRGNLISREGSWQAGVHGAVAGTIMPWDPHPTDAYRQEFLAGHAEDQAWIVQRGFSMTVPYKKVGRLVRSYEWTRLEPRVISMKIYAPGLGIVMERDVAGGTELFQLTSVSRP
jgi:hypothetical protein